MIMKFFTVVFIFFFNTGFAQQWQAELMVGATGYHGDLAASGIDFKTIGPAVNLNLKYLLANNFIVLRAGIGYGKIKGSDANSKSADLQRRNLSFKSNILEGSLCVEINLVDPDEYDGYPYLFAGVGFFHFNPYTYDKNNKKIFLQPLGTEGQGLAEYPNRFLYSLTKACIPFGLGWKYKVNDKYDLIYELGFRYTNTDYLDDVSSTYADPQVLMAHRGAEAAELAWRYKTPATAVAGRIRGNPEAKDWYYMTGIKILIKLGAQ